MLGDPRLQRCLTAIYERRKLARNVWLGVLFLWGMFALWTWKYSATAVVRETPSAAQESGANALDLALSILTDQRLMVVLKDLRTYPDASGGQGEFSALRYLRSRISLQSVAPQGTDSGFLRITYSSADKSTAIRVANAVALSMTAAPPRPTGFSSADTAATIDRQLKDSRIELKHMAAKQRSGGRRSARRREQPAGQQIVPGNVAKQAAPQEPPAAIPSPQASVIEALQQQVRDAGVRLAELRQRYTDEYPDVQDAQENLQELRSRLSRLQAESARLQSEALAAREKQTELNLALAQKVTLPAPTNPQTSSERGADSSMVGRAYAFELDRYHVLQRAKKNMRALQEYEHTEGATAEPPFMLVQSATQAKLSGFVAEPLYWLSGLFVALLASTLALAFAPRRETAVEADEVALQDPFEEDQLTPRYRIGAR